MTSRATSLAEHGHWPALALGAWLLFAALPAQAQSAIESLEHTPPRAFGWRIGDRFHRDIVLRLHAPWRLETEGLPRPGRHTHWIALAPVQIEERTAGAIIEYRVRLIYQLIGISPEFSDIALPEVMLRMSDDQETQEAMIPASRLRVGTITDFEGHDLRPAQAPVRLRQSALRPAAWGGVLALALASFAWLRWGDRFGRRRPFLELARRFASYGGGDWQADAYRDALRAVHTAINDTAGHVVFAESIDAFLVAHPRYASLAPELREYFQRSNACFYDPADTAPRYSRTELSAFIGRCAALERGAA